MVYSYNKRDNTIEELKEFKKSMRDYFNNVADKEERETFKSWFTDYMTALEEE